MGGGNRPSTGEGSVNKSPGGPTNRGGGVDIDRRMKAILKVGKANYERGCTRELVDNPFPKVTILEKNITGDSVWDNIDEYGSNLPMRDFIAYNAAEMGRASPEFFSPMTVSDEVGAKNHPPAAKKTTGNNRAAGKHDRKRDSVWPEVSRESIPAPTTAPPPAFIPIVTYKVPTTLPAAVSAPARSYQHVETYREPTTLPAAVSAPSRSYQHVNTYRVPTSFPGVPRPPWFPPPCPYKVAYMRNNMMPMTLAARAPGLFPCLHMMVYSRPSISYYPYPYYMPGYFSAQAPPAS